MMRRLPVSLFLLLAISGMVQAEMKIGFVDLTRVLAESERRKALESGMKEKQLRLTNQERSRLDAIEVLRQRSEGYAMGTPERVEVEKQLRDALRDLDAWRAEQRRALDEEFTTLILAIYKEIETTAGELAAEQGFDMVIKEQSMDARPKSRDDAVLQISQRIVLYGRPEYDLTSQIVARMNARCAAPKQPGGEGAPER